MTLPLDISPFFSGEQLSFDASGLPQGLVIDPSTGVISGTPTTVQTQAVAVTATNAAGAATQNFTWTITAAATPPGQVSGLTATPGDGAITLAWNAPADNGSALTDYVIERAIDGGAFSTVADGPGTATAFTDTGLTNGLAHAYRIAAVNSEGTGPVSAIANANPQASANAVSIASFDHDQNPDSATVYTFPAVSLSDGTAVIGVSTRGSGGTAITAVTVGGVAAAPIGASVGDTGSSQVQNFFVLDGVSAGAHSVTVTLSQTASRCGVHAWTLANADLASAEKSQLFSGGASGTVSVDAPADGAVIALGTVVTPSAPELVWTGLTQRQAWTDYGDTYGAGTADALFAQATPVHNVTAAFNGALGMISVLAVPPA
ncbi:MAG: fibronectin type III domain-containing protein [Pseudomonadota bacterium]